MRNTFTFTLLQVLFYFILIVPTVVGGHAIYRDLVTVTLQEDADTMHRKADNALLDAEATRIEHEVCQSVDYIHRCTQANINFYHYQWTPDVVGYTVAPSFHNYMVGELAMSADPTSVHYTEAMMDEHHQIYGAYSRN